MVTNPWTGVTEVLSDTQKNMYVQIKELEISINRDTDWTGDNKKRNAKIREFHKLKNQFREKWYSTYMNLLD